jgi:diguanylate cyclase (GGDEF)-like protein
VGGWERDIATNTITLTEEAARIRDLPPGTVLTHEQTLAFYDPEERPQRVAEGIRAIKDGTPWEHESLLTLPTGRRVWIHSRGEAVIRDGKTVGLAGAMQDITDRKLAELELLRRTRELEMHNSILRQIHQGRPLTATLDSLSVQVEALHPGMLCSIHLIDDEGKHLRLATAPSFPVFFRQAVDGLAIGDGVFSCGTAAYRGERVIVDNIQQHPYWLSVRDLAAQAGLQSCWSQPIKDRLGNVLGTFAIYHRQPMQPGDEEIALIESYATLAQLVIERHRAEEQIRSLAYYDGLTQLPNRRMLDDRLTLAMAVSKRSGRYGALMFLDLDNFKPLNDTHGHAVGDLLLVQVAQRISGCVREMDSVARFGGDEFVVMLGELDEDRGESAAQARLVAEKVRSVLAEPYVLTFKQSDNQEISVEHRCSASIGVVLFINHEATPDDIIKWADLAMYRAKDEGRNRICLTEKSGF